MNHTDRKQDVIIIGAGLAGHKAALELKAAGRRVLVLEARDRVGRCSPGFVPQTRFCWRSSCLRSNAVYLENSRSVPTYRGV